MKRLQNILVPKALCHLGIKIPCVIQQIKYYTQQNDTQHNGFVVMLSINYAKCHVLNVVNKLLMLSVVQLNVIILNVVLLSVAAPSSKAERNKEQDLFEEGFLSKIHRRKVFF